jgi:hypothetical protein
MIGDRDALILKRVEGTDEPCFVLRAQDSHSVELVEQYLKLVKKDKDVNDDFVRAVEAVVADFKQWQETYPTRVKSPDL